MIIGSPSHQLRVIKVESEDLKYHAAQGTPLSRAARASFPTITVTRDLCLHNLRLVRHPQRAVFGLPGTFDFRRIRRWYTTLTTGFAACLNDVITATEIIASGHTRCARDCAGSPGDRPSNHCAAVDSAAVVVWCGAKQVGDRESIMHYCQRNRGVVFMVLTHH